eukprot:gene4433-14567_t
MATFDPYYESSFQEMNINQPVPSLLTGPGQTEPSHHRGAEWGSNAGHAGGLEYRSGGGGLGPASPMGHCSELSHNNYHWQKQAQAPIIPGKHQLPCGGQPAPLRDQTQAPPKASPFAEPPQLHERYPHIEAASDTYAYVTAHIPTSGGGSLKGGADMAQVHPKGHAKPPVGTGAVLHPPGARVMKTSETMRYEIDQWNLGGQAQPGLPGPPAAPPPVAMAGSDAPMHQAPKPNRDHGGPDARGGPGETRGPGGPGGTKAPLRSREGALLALHQEICWDEAETSPLSLTAQTLGQIIPSFTSTLGSHPSGAPSASSSTPGLRVQGRQTTFGHDVKCQVCGTEGTVLAATSIQIDKLWTNVNAVHYDSDYPNSECGSDYVRRYNSDGGTHDTSAPRGGSRTPKIMCVQLESPGGAKTGILEVLLQRESPHPPPPPSSTRESPASGLGGEAPSSRPPPSRGSGSGAGNHAVVPRAPGLGGTGAASPVAHIQSGKHLRMTPSLVFEYMLEAALRSDCCGPHHLQIDGPWKWLLDHFAASYGVRKAHALLSHLRWVLQPANSTLTDTCLKVVRDVMKVLIEEGRRALLTQPEIAVLTKLKHDVGKLLETAFEAYYTLWDKTQGGQAPRQAALQ